MKQPEPLSRLVAALSRLPGVGRRSAERMALHLAREGAGGVGELVASLDEVAKRVCACSLCGSLTLREEEPCRLCTDPRRDSKLLCVVEEPGDILLLERTGGFQGRYHSLHGRLSPLRETGVADLRVDAMLERVKKDGVAEVILALNPDVEGDSTASFLRQALAPTGVKVTRLARGLPAGGELAYADAVTLFGALQARQPV